MENFLRHQYNFEHTSNIYDHVIDNLIETVIIKVPGFYENYTCILPQEIMAIHCTQENATVLPAAIIRLIESIIKDEKFAFTSGDLRRSFCWNLQ